MKKLNLLFLSLFLILPTIGHSKLFGFCFNQNVSLRSAHYKLKEILLRRDKVFYRKSKNCLEIELSEARKELVEKYIYQNIGRVRISSDDGVNLNNLNVNKICKIQIIKKDIIKTNHKEYKIGKDSKLMHGKSEGESSTVVEMVLTQGLKGIIKMGKEEAEIKCKEFGTGKYQIQVFVSNDNNGKTSSLNSSILVGQGTPFEIGSIVEDLKNKNQGISTKVGFDKKAINQKSNTQYFILVK